MVQISNFGKVDSLSIWGEINMPLVILKETAEKGIKYIGFIPGLTALDITSNNLSDCRNILKQEANNIIKEMAKNNNEFPFFPTKEELLETHKNIVEIIFIKIKSQKRKK